MEFKIAVIPGDGIGVDVTREAVRVLDQIAGVYGHTFRYEKRLVGGCCIDAFGTPIQEETLKICEECDAILFGAAGGPRESGWLPTCASSWYPPPTGSIRRPFAWAISRPLWRRGRW